MSHYVLIFSLGPVQSFIAEARRTNDLYAGSQMLSDLAKVAAQALGGDLILPAAVNEDMPNKLVAIVADPQAAAKAAQDKVREHWRNFANDALRNGYFSQEGDFQSIWDRQIEHHLEFYWTAAEIQNGDYIKAYQAAVDALDARKQTRTFPQVIEDGLKDSISGRRSALREQLAVKAVKAYWNRVAQRHPSKVKADEWLDAIGAMKRFALGQPFPSVSTVASTPFVRACHEAGLLNDLIQAIEAFNHNVGHEFFYKVDENDQWKRGFKYDGDLLYEETYADTRLRASYGASRPTEVVAALRRLYQSTKEQNIRPVKPSPYYAVLAMDGDQMGKHLGVCRSMDEHHNLSVQLAKFADRVRELVKPPHGCLIYAGGEDVLALLPLQAVLSLVSQIQVAYRETFNSWPEESLPLNEKGERIHFTISAGIAIAHHLYPLDAALEEARRAEKAAKNAYRRDALCISVLKRSGEAMQVGGKWECVGIAGGTLKLFEQVKDHFEQRELSSKFAYEVLAEARTVTGIPGAGQATLKRLLKRHKSEALLKETQEALERALVAWAAAHDPVVPKQKLPNGSEDPTPQGLVGLGRWLVLARFIAQGGGE